jgi:hypothetical protein
MNMQYFIVLYHTGAGIAYISEIWTANILEWLEVGD